ncbi:MAG: universal stress protein [Thermoanaerobaculia bacterium]
MYQRILVPTDMSEFANLALRYAAAFRDNAGSALTLLYADEVVFPADLLEAPIGRYLEQAPADRWKLQERLREYGKAHIGGSFETLVLTQAPVRAILDAARDVRADLIIIGTHGRHGVRRAVLGSVTEHLLHETDTPVLTVTPELMSNPKEIAVRRILCPVNFTRVARESLNHACQMAEVFGAELQVLYVVEEIEKDRVSEVETAFRHWIDPQIADRCVFTHMVMHDGDPAERALEAAAQWKADLIVVGAQHKFFSDSTVIGTTTQRITRFARIPVLTVAMKARKEVHEHAPEPAGVM